MSHWLSRKELFGAGIISCIGVASGSRPVLCHGGSEGATMKVLPATLHPSQAVPSTAKPISFSRFPTIYIYIYVYRTLQETTLERFGRQEYSL